MSIQTWVNRPFKGSNFQSFFYVTDDSNGELSSYVFFPVDNGVIIAIETSPLSPKEFIDRNQEYTYILDDSIPFKKAEGRTIYFAKPQEATGDIISGELRLPFLFISSDHLRYENKIRVAGFHGGAPRAIKIDKNIFGNAGYTCTIFNTEGTPTMQVTPKQMKVSNPELVNKYFDDDVSRLVLIGFGSDPLGNSFADYGMTLYFKNNIVLYVALHLLDRNIDIVYYK